MGGLFGVIKGTETYLKTYLLTSKMKIIVTIPAYNEEKSIARIIKEIKQAMDSRKYNYQVLVLDDGSKDHTAEVAKKSGAVVYSHPKNYGLAETFKTEMEKALQMKADIIVHIDADGQYMPSEIPKLIDEVNKGNDLVLGSRFKGYIESMPLIKRLGNNAFSKVISQITKTHISDAQTGFRAFTKEVAKSISITSRYTYTQEQIIRAIKQKFKIKEIPVYFAKRNGKSRLVKNAFDYALKAWLTIIRIYRDHEPLKFFGVIGGIIFGAGFFLGLYLIYFQLFGEGIFRHLGLMILDVAILFTGLQLIMFAFLADMFRK